MDKNLLHKLAALAEDLESMGRDDDASSIDSIISEHAEFEPKSKWYDSEHVNKVLEFVFHVVKESGVDSEGLYNRVTSVLRDRFGRGFGDFPRTRTSAKEAVEEAIQEVIG